MKKIGCFISNGFNMLTLSRLSTALDLANSIRKQQKRYQLTLLSADGGTIYSACKIPVESSIANFKTLCSLNSMFIMENPQDSCLFWNTSPCQPSPADGSHKVKYVGKQQTTSSEWTSPLSFLAAFEKKEVRYQLSTFSQAIPNVNLKKESVLLLNNHIWAASGNWAGIDLTLTIIEEESGPGTTMQLMNIIERMFDKYVNNSQLAVLQNFSCHGNSERINLSLRYIREHLRNTVTITQLAELTHLSPRQFSRLFKEETGTSPAKAVAQMRAEVARQHVIQARLSLEKIASLCGFSGTKSMRRAFLKFYGESPGHFRSK
ncbi:helix-turn-helix domain-containing protein [Rouxiella badensis]|uniref:helix-turn-helix domain-containing protein n=1 Tax=Rouxiella badensis TaxID=1646377 RepID=UPI001D136AAF|nr:helix-turn-helix domain-containing protein [Rouxiella badensis]MCC3718733.1 helix-turn-helix domain-containing protein [Rouxiella badensis]MCC3727928.1 helix-turn-helix domain-containing protein [Rouxiella badensis]MCC3732904.1 helix-turn-helix domain-containing protein [Rouxiella badensis]MCC3739672.1 helix-turn-helix domain-containing protein [Rouxiella badensis]MCC3757650.1 helix-turn-helix domain-containing protein [Rouxiella badensis]